jgi:hypothetical protein
MKRSLPVVLATLTLACGLTAGLAAQPPLPPGQVDFGKFTPAGSGKEFVEVNLTTSLISFAARLIEKQEPDVARILNGLKSVRVNVIGLDDDNRGDLQKRVSTLRADLTNKGWERIVTAQKEDQDVGVYLKTGVKDSVQGIVVTVIEGNHQAVFVNIVGEIKPEQIALLGEKFHIDPLKKLGVFQESSEKAEPSEKSDKSDQ